MSVEDVKLSNPTNKSLRAAVHKNVVEQSTLDNTSRTLEAQRRSTESRLTREEREIKAQLQRLQNEQRHLSELDYAGML